MQGRGGARPGAGRKARSPGDKRKALSTTVSAASWRRLKALAGRTGRSMSEVLDQLIALAATHPTVAALLAEEGLAGPDDLREALLSFGDADDAATGAKRVRPLILVVEDDPSSLDLMKVRLDFMGCDVLASDAPEEAFALACSERPGLIVVDLALRNAPDGGLRLIRRLREAEETAKIPIAIHSIYVRHPGDLPQPLPRVEALLPKPFKFKQLVDLVAAHYRADDAAADATRVTII